MVEIYIIISACVCNVVNGELIKSKQFNSKIIVRIMRYIDFELSMPPAARKKGSNKNHDFLYGLSSQAQTLNLRHCIRISMIDFSSI